MSKKLKDSLKQQKKKTKREVLQLTGTLGLPLAGRQVVEVPNRNAFVYVKLRDNQSEVIQAYNNKVAPSYGLPVILEYRSGRYYITDVDTIRYQNNWSGFSPFLPRHGNTHSFDTDSSGGGDVVWVHSRQFMPSLVIPSGTLGAPNVLMSSYMLRNVDGSWKYVGNTGTSSLLPYKSPTGTQAVMALVYLDVVSGNPQLMVGSGSYFPANLTGSADIAPYIPSISNPNHIPLAAVRLVSGTGAILWDNIYDVRQFLHPLITGSASSGGGSGTTVQVLDEGIPLGSVDSFNFVGAGVDVTVSGTMARVHITGSSGGGIANLTGTAMGLPNAVVLTNASGYLDTMPWLRWGTATRPFIEFGADIAGKEVNAGRMGYGSFGTDDYLYIVGAGTDGGNRWVRIYDNLYADLVYGGNFQLPNLLSSIALATDSNGVVIDGGTALDARYAPIGMFGEGWIPRTETWTRTGNHTFTLDGDYTGIYRKGVRVKYDDSGGGPDYGVIIASSVAGGTTTITLATNTDYVMEAGSITDTYISYMAEPMFFPDYFNFTLSGAAGGTMTVTITTTTAAKFKPNVNGSCDVVVQFTMTTTGTASTQVVVDAPIPVLDSESYPITSANTDTGTPARVGLGVVNGSSVLGAANRLQARKLDGSVWTIKTGTIVQIRGEYPY